jgi:predicted enzyme related to lactoylglutathione lyase
VLTVHAYIEVADLEHGITFYCDGLGLRLKHRLSPRWVELDGTNLPVFLLGDRSEVAELGTTHARRDFGRHWTPVHLDFIIEGLDAMVERLIGRGASLDRSIQSREYGRIANMADPFGNGFDLIEFAGPGYDKVGRF